MRVQFKPGKVIGIVGRRKGLTEVEVEVEGKTAAALNYDHLTGEVRPGDEVILNTLAVEFNLGTGEKHFVFWNLSCNFLKSAEAGHIMKLRYTPLQFSLLSVEEQESPYHALMQEDFSLQGMPVIIGSLHSQLPAAVATLKEVDNSLKVAYIMTDGGALPLSYSNLVDQLKAKKLIETTITIGQAFGGDLEAINIFSGLAAAKKVAGADVAVVMMGPGIVGTDTLLGFSGIEQGEIINAIACLEGRPIAIPRISFKDKRKRHYGVSHHTLTALSLAALAPATVTIPKMSIEKMKLILSQLEKSGVAAKHDIRIVENEVTLGALEKYGLKVTTMGRTVKNEPEFFLAAGSAALHALQLLNS